MLAAGVRILRPRDEVEAVGLDELEEEVARFHPHLVISSQPKTVSLGDIPAWVELSLDLARSTKVCVGGRRSEMTNPTLEELLRVINEVE